MCKLLCCSALVFAFILQAENNAIEKSDKNQTHSDVNATPFSGFTIGAGVNIGNQNTSSDVNKEFSNDSASINSTTYGGTVTLCYQKPVCGNFTVGVEAGIDFGQNNKTLHTGSTAAYRNLINKSGYLQKATIVKQMFTGISNALFVENIYRSGASRWPTNDCTVKNNVWKNFLCSMRYFGGNTNNNIAGLINADHTPGNKIAQFMKNISNSSKVYDIIDTSPNPNENAVFASFAGKHTLNNIMHLTNGELQQGYREIRNFITEYYPNLAHTLGRIGEQDFFVFSENGSATLQGTNINGTSNVRYDLGASISDIFEANKPFEESNESRLGIDLTPEEQKLLKSDIDRLYNQIDQDFMHKQINTDIGKQLKIKTSFYICPHIALKAGYFIKKIESFIYAKAGIIQLQGTIALTDDFANSKEEKFNKITPFFAIGASKMINKHWGISIEISHALRTNKKMPPIMKKSPKIENNISIRKTDLRILATYSI